MQDFHGTLDLMRRQLGAFHDIVEQAHRQTAARTMEQTRRQLRYLGALAHRTTQDAWAQTLAALQEAAGGFPDASAALEPSTLALPALAARARRCWQENLAEAVASVVERVEQDPDELHALAQAVRAFFDELERVAREHPMPGEPG